AGADREKTLVFYCLKDCWMSWNAAKHALSLGYPYVAWYPDGTDGWTAASLPVEPVTAAPRPES
ncbi:MAG TPA: PQQ-dependent catabolism-associated CXXCW motif protein, partial [Rhodomicrobium sp.]|nr:PQQ-dependent catabolism-associated CXXCW motif protein [Rhodomicrobium sp.]